MSYPYVYFQYGDGAGDTVEENSSIFSDCAICLTVL